MLMRKRMKNINKRERIFHSQGLEIVLADPLNACGELKNTNAKGKVLLRVQIQRHVDMLIFPDPMSER